MSGDDATGGAGILYFDANATTARLATISLKRGGYRVFPTGRSDEAVALCRKHGPGGDRKIALLLLDASADPQLTARLLAELIALPGSDELAGMLMVSRRNPNPIPGVEELPTLRRPFTRTMLLEGVARALGESRPGDIASLGSSESMRIDPVTMLRRLIDTHIPDAAMTDGELEAFLEALGDVVPASDAGHKTPGLEANLGVTPPDVILEMIGNSGAAGVLTLTGADAQRVQLYVRDGGVAHAEYTGDEDDFHLVRFLLAAGVSERALEGYRDSTPSPIPLGKRVAEDGNATRAVVARASAARNHAIGCHVLSWHAGHASFRATRAVPSIVEYLTEEGGYESDIPSILLQGLRTAEEAAMMGPQMPGVDDVFVRNDRRVSMIGQEAFTDDELMILELVNGRNSVKEIARKTGGGSFVVASALFRMGRAGIVRLTVPPVAARG